jgi:hypothetical protein
MPLLHKRNVSSSWPLKWIKEAVRESLKELASKELIARVETEEKLLNRKEVANLLRISLVTLTDWMKRGLPYHKQRGRFILWKQKFWTISKSILSNATF